MWKKYILPVLFCAALLCVTACAGNETDVYLPDDGGTPYQPLYAQSSPAPDKPSLPTETPYGDTAGGFSWEGLTASRLTGLPIPEEDALRRPVAVVVNNIYPALPQSGISQADLIYEVLAEGNITRLVAIFQHHDAPRIGPVRSARDYFVDFALDYDAIFVHHGGSPSGYAKLSNTKINRLDGINLEGTYFWRDRTYPDWDTIHAGKTRPLEHSSYINSENIKTAIAKFGFRETLYEDTHFGFLFNASPPAVRADGSMSAAVVRVPFSKDYTRVFTFDPETSRYAVSNRNGPHMDANTAEPLYVTNIIIQQVKMRVIAGDEAGRREVWTVGQGNGFLVTAGEYTSIKWEKKDQSTPTSWYFENGDELRLNAGQTWICVFQDSGEVEFEKEVQTND